MPQRGFVGEVERIFEVRAAFGRERADLVRNFGSLRAGHAVGPEPGRARERHHAEFVLRLELRGERAQRFLDDAHAIRAFHRAGVVEQQNDIQRLARLASLRRGLDREAHHIAIVRERIARPLPGEGHRHARRRFRVAIIEGIDELLAAHGGRVRHNAFFQTRHGQFEGHVGDVEGEGGERVVAGLDLRLRDGSVGGGLGRGDIGVRGRGFRWLTQQLQFRCYCVDVVCPFGVDEHGDQSSGGYV